MRVLITGAGGFIGSQLARLLVGESCEVFALLRPGSDPDPTAAHPVAAPDSRAAHTGAGPGRAGESLGGGDQQGGRRGSVGAPCG